MLYTISQVTIKNNISTLDRPIILYRGDMNVQIQFLLVDRNFAEYIVEETNVIDNLDASFGQLIILKPNGNVAVSEIAATQNGKIIFTMPSSMLDEESEIGVFTFQIRLYNKSMTSRVTLPPCMDGIVVEEPIATEMNE